MSHYDPANHPQPICIRCGRTPTEIGYATYRKDEDGEEMRRTDGTLQYRDDNDYVWQEEGTLNRENGHFACDDCYIRMGSPTSPIGWKAP